jgi:predicted kinase
LDGVSSADVVAALLAELPLPPAQWRPPVLIGLFGLPGAGKTTVTQWLARRHPLVLLSTDALRLRYGLPSGPATLAVMEHVAHGLFARGASVVFDGIHLGRKQRLSFRDLGRQCGAVTWLLYVTAPPAVIEARLQARLAAPEQTVAEGKFVITPEHFVRIAAYLEPPTDDEDVLRVDTATGSLDAPLAPLDAQLRAWWEGATPATRRNS